jgi:hypothetical protein
MTLSIPVPPISHCTKLPAVKGAVLGSVGGVAGAPDTVAGGILEGLDIYIEMAF